MPPQLPLGREVSYPRRYDASLLFPIPRAQGRAALGVAGDALPFIGHDRWHAYELGWLASRGQPVVATATFSVPADSPNLIESKSLKLYLNSFNGERFPDTEAVRACIAGDLSKAAGAPVDVALGLPPVDADAHGLSIDACDVDVEDFAPPNPRHLVADPRTSVDETLRSGLLKSNCPVTGQPDWASVRIAYRGARIDRAGLLRYLASFREHAEFHEQCVERIFIDVLARCTPETLAVDARYTRRGGLDINPWRASPGSTPPSPGRDPRQ
jgi:7-cyano-7-deazaguanine reductase